jgi:hypothetical protein
VTTGVSVGLSSISPLRIGKRRDSAVCGRPSRKPELVHDDHGAHLIIEMDGYCVKCTRMAMEEGRWRVSPRGNGRGGDLRPSVTALLPVHGDEPRKRGPMHSGRIGASFGIGRDYARLVRLVRRAVGAAGEGRLTAGCHEYLFRLRARRERADPSRRAPQRRTSCRKTDTVISTDA